jgi:hypothetical protein
MMLFMVMFYFKHKALSDKIVDNENVHQKYKHKLTFLVHDFSSTHMLTYRKKSFFILNPMLSHSNEDKQKRILTYHNC